MQRVTPLAVAVLALAARGAHAQDDPTAYETLVTRHAPAVVTVKAVLKTEVKMGGSGQTQESRVNITGVVVSPDGLVMVSNTPFSPMRALEMMGMPAEMGDVGMKATPTSVKVVFESEEKEYDAFLAATDTNLDLAFVQVEGLGDRKLPFVDFGAATSAVVGQKVVQVCRLGRGYDYAPYFQTARVNGEIAKPRLAWMLEGSVSTFGLPVFAQSGEVIGVLTTIPSGLKEQGAAEGLGLGMFMRMMTGGGGSGAGGAFVLPAAVVKGVVEQAKVRAVEVAAERAKPKPPSAPTQATKPAAPTKPATPPAKPPTKPKSGK